MANVIHFKPDKCTSCKRCETACSHKYFNVFTNQLSKIKCVTFDEENLYFPVTCFQCNNPPCLSACPVDAISQRPDGIVLVDPEPCIGCKACLEACPFGVMQFNSEKGVAEKCHLCYHRIDRGERPACVDKCIGRCIHFGTVEEVLARLGDKRLKINDPWG